MVTGGVRWERVLPGVARLRHYDRAWLRGDLLAGITVAAYLVPQVMAYAVIAGLPPVAGLWACLAPFLVYALFGSSGQLSVGPESTTAVMTAAGVASLVGLAGPGRYAEAASLLAVAVGVICLIGYAGRLGFLAELLSKPVLVGYMAGVALLMIASQFGKLLKLTLSATEPIDEFGEAVTRLGEAHGPTVLLSIAVIAALFAMGRWRPRWPGPLNAILIASAAVAAFDLDRYGITTIGPVPAGLPALRVPDFAGLSLPTVFAAALGVAIVGYSDNVLTARAFAAKRNEHIDSNQEFLALGLANITAGLSSGFPVSSSGSRTVIGDAMGSRTQLHSLVALLGVLVTMFFLGPVLASFPSAALGGVVVYAALRLIDVSEW